MALRFYSYFNQNHWHRLHYAVLGVASVHWLRKIGMCTDVLAFFSYILSFLHIFFNLTFKTFSLSSAYAPSEMSNADTKLFWLPS